MGPSRHTCSIYYTRTNTGAESERKAHTSARACMHPRSPSHTCIHTRGSQHRGHYHFDASVYIYIRMVALWMYSMEHADQNVCDCMPMYIFCIYIRIEYISLNCVAACSTILTVQDGSGALLDSSLMNGSTLSLGRSGERHKQRLRNNNNT